MGRVLERGRSERVDSVIEDPNPISSFTRELGMLTALYVPLRLRTELIGLIVAGDKLVPDLRFSSEDLRLAETFASRAAVAADQARRVQRDALRRVVHAQEEERRRLARELHDETGQALASILLGLKTLEEAGDVGELRDRVAALRARVVETLQDVRGSQSSCVRPRSTTSGSSLRSSDWRPASPSRPASRLSSSRGLTMIVSHRTSRPSFTESFRRR